MKPIEGDIDYDKIVQIKPIEAETKPIVPPHEGIVKPPEPLPVETKKPPVPSKKKAKAEKITGPKKHLPPEEIGEGFDGRRPLIDPFRPGEKIELDLTYMNIKAGTLAFETKPFVEVNNRKAYHFRVSIKSSSLFNMIYSVDNYANSYVDFENLVPLSHDVAIKESKQLVDSRSYFDWKNMKAMFWENRYTKEKGDRKRKVEWDLAPFAQNVITSMFYVRVFKMIPGRDVTFTVTDNGKNIMFHGKILRKEKISTALGEFDTMVMKAELEVDGTFAPVGDVYYWFTDDDHRHLVKMQIKIKIGSFYGELRTREIGSSAN